jgi:initiation factor 1A
MSLSASKPLFHSLRRMPANARGGRGYRKGKHTSEDDKVPEWDTAQGQMLGRVTRKLGNRRFEVFCNDNKKRKCKLCGSMRKSEWVDEASLVLLATRGLSNAASGAREDAEDVGDILMTIARSLHGKLKKMPGVNPLLFLNVEQQDERDLRNRIQAQERGETFEDDIFEEASDDEEEGSEGGEDSDEGLTGEEKAKKKQLGREEKAKKQTQKLDAARAKKREADDREVDDKFIDDI